MGQISYDTFSQMDTGNNNSYDVGFFNLKDGEEAIVRFMIDSPADFDIITSHPIQLDGKFRQVSCIRDPREDVSKCPLCSAGEKVQHNIFLKLIHYEVDASGVVTPKAKVWQRNASVFAPMMKNYLDSYGPLSNIVCKVVRHGKMLDTKYDVIPNINPSVYNEQSYPIVKDAFSDYKVLGRVVLDKTYDEIVQFMRTGNFPQNTTEQVIPTQAPSPVSEIDNPNIPYSDLTPRGSDNHVPIQTEQMSRPTRYW